MDEVGDAGPVGRSSSFNEENALQACCFCRCQGNIQSFVRPGIWLPGFRSPHMYQETWQIATNPPVCMRTVISAVRSLNVDEQDGRLYELAKVDDEACFIQINAYTYGQSLHVIEIHFSENTVTACTEAKVRSFSSGLLPVSVPLCFLWNCFLFFVPFCDCGQNRFWLHSIRGAMETEVKVVSARRGC